MTEEFIKLTETLRNKISDELLDDNLELFQFSDPTMAIENICSQIHEGGITITSEQSELLKVLCRDFGVDGEYLDYSVLQSD